MKNKSTTRTIILLAGLIINLISSPLFSQSLTIDQNHWKNESERSISTSFSIELENELITIYSDKSFENISIEIKNISGIIVFQTMTFVPAEIGYSINITNIPSGCYTIKIFQGENYITANFNK